MSNTLIRGCCDDENCTYCHGSGIVEVTEAEDLAMDVLCMTHTCDLNDPECTDAIRKLAKMILKLEVK